MLLRLHTLQPPLSAYVELFTYYEDYAPDHSIERLLPEGVVEIVIDLTDDPKLIFDNHTLKPAQSCRKSWISGMRSRYISIGVGRRSAMFVIRFRRGMAWRFLQMPMAEIDDMVVDAEQVLGASFSSMRQRLMDAESIEQKFIIAERCILERMKSGSETHPAIQYTLHQMLSNPSTATINEIVRKTGYSHKHFLSLFGKHVGLTPKQFLRIAKFQQAVRDIESRSHIHWTQLAHDCGYYDQAHFINDFKEFSGFSPTDYMYAKGEFVNYVPLL